MACLFSQLSRRSVFSTLIRGETYMNRGPWRPTAITGLLLACGSITASADGGNTQGEKPLASADSTAQVVHRAVKFDASFERFTSALQKILGHFPADIQQDIIDRPQLAAQ